MSSQWFIAAHGNHKQTAVWKAPLALQQLDRLGTAKMSMVPRYPLKATRIEKKLSHHEHKKPCAKTCTNRLIETQSTRKCDDLDHNFWVRWRYVILRHTQHSSKQNYSNNVMCFCLSEPLSAHCVSHSTLPVPGAISTVTSKVSPPAKEIYGYLTPCWFNNCLITKHFKSLKRRNPHYMI